MQRCGQCSTCLKPSLKKGCIMLKAAQEADRALRSVPIRRHKLLVDAVPLAKLTEQPATTSAAANEDQPGLCPSLDPIVIDSIHPSVDTQNTEHQGEHCWPENNKRAASEDSENQGCHKRRCFANSSTEPLQLPVSRNASSDAPSPFQCQTQVFHTAASWHAALLAVVKCNLCFAGQCRR